jgi:hypothetical protein
MAIPVLRPKKARDHTGCSAEINDELAHMYSFGRENSHRRDSAPALFSTFRQ